MPHPPEVGYWRPVAHMNGAHDSDAAGCSDASRRAPPIPAAAGAALLLLLTVLAYVPALRAGYVWDDASYVQQNVTLRSLQGLRQIWFEPLTTPQYYPLVFTSFWLEYHLWGVAPGGYHFTNVCLHALNALLVWLLLRRLGVAGAFFAGLVFALHPVHVESVAWISERKDVLSGTFYLLTLVVWLDYIETRAWRYYALALVLFVGAMLSKTMAATLPLALLLLTWWKGGPRWWRASGLLLPFAGVAAGLGLITVWRENFDARAATSLSLVERTLVAGRALWFYAGKLLWPVDLMAMYPRWRVDATAVGQYGWLFAAILIPVMLWRLRHRLGKGPLVAVLFFAIALAPALGWQEFHFMQYSFVADHFQYLASVGLIGLFAAVAAQVAAVRLPTRTMYAAGGAIVIALATLTTQQAQIYQDGGTLWRHNLAKNPDAWGAHLYLGRFLAGQGKFDEALHHFNEAVRLNPNDATVLQIVGTFLAERGMLDGALEHLNRSLEINPDDAEAHYNLGTVLFKHGQRDEAVRQFNAAIAIRPDLARAHNNLGVIFFQEGHLDEALRQLEMAVRIEPGYAEAHNALGVALSAVGRLDAAVEQFRSALRLEPAYTEAQDNLTRALAGPPADAAERGRD